MQSTQSLAYDFWGELWEYIQGSEIKTIPFAIAYLNIDSCCWALFLRAGKKVFLNFYSVLNTLNRASHHQPIETALQKGRVLQRLLNCQTPYPILSYLKAWQRLMFLSTLLPVLIFLAFAIPFLDSSFFISFLASLCLLYP